MGVLELGTLTFGYVMSWWILLPQPVWFALSTILLLACCLPVFVLLFEMI